MGSAQSAAARTPRGSKKARINRLREKQAEIDQIEKQLHALKIQLYRTKVEGIMQRDKRDEEIYKVNTETYRKRTDLMKKGKEASKSIPFQEYLRIARNPGHKGKKPKGKEASDTPSADSDKASQANGVPGSNGTTQAPASATETAKTTTEQPKPSRFSRAIMLRNFNFPLANTLYSYLEAYLLKRLHMAMLQEHQQKIHGDRWSENVSKLFMEIDPLKKESVDIKSKLKRKVDARKDYNEDMLKIYEDHIRQQELVIYRYEQAPYAAAADESSSEEVLPEDIDESFHVA